MPEIYKVHGLRLASTLPFPHLPTQPGPETNDPDLVLDVASAVADAPAEGAAGELLWDCRSEGHLSLSVFDTEEGTLFRYHRGVDFLVHADLHRVTCRAAPGVNEELIRYLFLSLVTSFILHRLDRPVLHAAAVNFGNEAVAFMGPPGQGKSSLTAFCVGIGCPLLSDDVLALEMRADRVAAHPGPPQLRLWPDSLSSLWGKPADYPRHALQTPKRQIWLPLTGRFYCQDPVPLRVIYILERDGSRTPLVTSASKRDSVLALVGSAFGNFLSNRECLSQQLVWFSDAIRLVACRRLRFPSGYAALPAIYQTVLNDFAGIRQAGNCLNVA